MSSGKGRSDDSPTSNATRTKHGTKVFASAAKTNQRKNPVNKSKTTVTTNSNCLVCKIKRPLWKCAVFRQKTPTERAKAVVAQTLCFFCLQDQHFFKQCPGPHENKKKDVPNLTKAYYMVQSASSNPNLQQSNKTKMTNFLLRQVMNLVIVKPKAPDCPPLSM